MHGLTEGSHILQVQFPAPCNFPVILGGELNLPAGSCRAAGQKTYCGIVTLPSDIGAPVPTPAEPLVHNGDFFWGDVPGV